MAAVEKHRENVPVKDEDAYKEDLERVSHVGLPAHILWL